MASARIRDRLARHRRVDLSSRADHPLFPLVFDGAWYLARYPDVMNSGLGAEQHFLSSGVHEGRMPSPYVDLAFVAESLPQARRSGSAALSYLLDRGLTAGTPTSPFVDLDWFGRQHGLEGRDPRERFEALATHGRAERLDPCPWMDLNWYAQEHAEVRLGGLDPFEYFLAAGRWLGRFPHPVWDERRYVGLNDYVRTVVLSVKFRSGFEQFCAGGWDEVVREAIAFPLRIGDEQREYSESGYRAANPDVESAVGSGLVRNGLEHLMRTGHREVAQGHRTLKEPSPFSEATVEETGVVPTGSWLVLLNHYDVDGRVDPHVLVAIDAYRSAGADVVLITTGLDEASREVLRERVTHIVSKSRNDDLRDFGGWHHALQALRPEATGDYSRIVLTNDSVYFPVRDPAHLLDRLGASSADVFAVTDAVSGGRYHLQSYFLALSPTAARVLVPEIARRVAEQVEATKLTLVQRFEIGLSAFMLRHGLTAEVLHPLRDIPDLPAALDPPDPRPVGRLASTVLNVTHQCWRRLLTHDVPFLKVELLRDNPTGADLSGWEGLVDGPCGVEHVEAHLARVRA